MLLWNARLPNSFLCPFVICRIQKKSLLQCIVVILTRITVQLYIHGLVFNGTVMPKRKVDDYFKCYGIRGVNDAAVRRVVQRLRDEKETEQHCPSFAERFQHLEGVLHCHEESGICTLNLQVYMDTLAEKSPDMKRFFQETLVAQHSGKESISGCLYADEAVPGNIIAPDNRRRSWCFYFTWDCWIPYRSDVLWLPLAIVRSDVVDQLAGGLPEALNIIMRQCLPFYSGIVVEDNLVVTSPLSLLADEDGLKKLVSHKGSSGIRPCISCGNCIAKNRTAAGYYSIDHNDFSDFTLQDDDTTRRTFEHLKHLHENSTAASLDDAEKLSGWKFNEHSWVWNDRLWNLLKPSRVVYDAMHCIWGNGIACLELGLFWQAASRNGVHRADLSAFLRSNWEQSLQIGNVPAGLASLAGPKLLKDDGSDYRGDSNQTLELVVLMSFFAQQALSGIEGLRDHIASLAALNRLCIAVLNAKLHPEQCPGLLALQEEHLKLFKKCYTAQRCRPKHHYSLHIERQVATSHMLMDTWPTERKHKVFKSDLAPRIKRLDRFERSIMMRWIEHDLSTLARSNFLNHLLQPLKEEVSGLKFGKGAYSKGCTLRTNNVLMFKNGDVWQAFLVVTCFQSKEGLGVIGQQLQLMESDPHMSWSKWILTEEYAPFSFAEASKTLRTSFLSKASDESMLLLRWTKVLLTFVVSMLSRKY